MISFDSEPTSERDTSSPEQKTAKKMLFEMVDGIEKHPYHSDQLRNSFDSEEDLLEYELNYRPPRHDTRFFKTNPAGFNVIRSMGAMFALGGWVCTVMVMSLFVDIRGMGSVLAVVMGLVVGAWLGFSFPERIWYGIGPSMRASLRPFGWFGGLPMIFLCLVGVAIVAGGIRTVFPQQPQTHQTAIPAQTRPPPPAPISWQGSDWRVLLDTSGKPRQPTRKEAQKACAVLGPGWRLPTASDTAFLNQRLSDAHTSSMFYADGPPIRVKGSTIDERPFFRFIWPHRWSIEHSSAEFSLKVLCIRR